MRGGKYGNAYLSVVPRDSEGAVSRVGLRMLMPLAVSGSPPVQRCPLVVKAAASVSRDIRVAGVHHLLFQGWVPVRRIGALLQPGARRQRRRRVRIFVTRVRPVVPADLHSASANYTAAMASTDGVAS